MTDSGFAGKTDTSTEREAATWLVRFGRLGYAAKGVVYVVMGFLATLAATGNGGRTTDSKGALRTRGDAPFGRIALVVVAAGLFGYAAWRLISAATDAEGRGDQASSIAVRVADAVRGLGYGSLGFWTLRLLTRDRVSNGNEARAVTSRIMELPGGRLIVIAAGLAFVGYALYQVYKAMSGKFLKRLDLRSAGASASSWIERLGKFGIVARAIVMGMIGVLIARAGWTYDPSKAGGIGKSLAAIAGQTNSQWIFGAVALGLIAFGVFQIITAHYRVMRAV
ncbi:MAG: DUF1206 domain-containing protein [Gemmatimonadaceae bacterium]